ncbi:hypothetical protein ACFP9V_17990 [Deinococcus radiopugnans]|uniref:hypothetical protein n=1 Tax=Deinococcus radiopugnans TaxID=57497 RepID=UPI00362321C4
MTVLSDARRSARSLIGAALLCAGLFPAQASATLPEPLAGMFTAPSDLFVPEPEVTLQPDTRGPALQLVTGGRPRPKPWPGATA